MSQIETGVYWIENLKTGDVYIGQTSRSFTIRDGEHDTDLVNRLHSNTKLQRAFNKYGRKAFKFRVLERSEGDLNRLEDKWILKKNAFYNVVWSDGTLIERDENGRIIPPAKARVNRFDDPFFKLAVCCAGLFVLLELVKQ
jgi:hypothetical protein